MRTSLVAALLLVSAVAAAQDAPKPMSIVLEPLGDSERGVVARVYFRFANPHAITEAGLYLEGSFIESGHVPRNFRFAVPRKKDRLIWNNTFLRNGKAVRNQRWSVLPDKRNEMSAVHTFAEGETEIEARLILEADYGGAPVLVAEATETFTLAKMNKPYVESEEAIVIEEETAPEPAGAVTIRASRRNVESTFFQIDVDVLPPVKRVEFWVENKKVLARNAPPYLTELDLGESPKNVALRAIGFDAAGRYVDADAFVVGEEEIGLAVKITRTATSDGFSHFKVSVQNPWNVRLKSVALYAGDRKLGEWERPPYAVSVANESLTDVEFVRASVIDESGSETRDVLSLHARQQ